MDRVERRLTPSLDGRTRSPLLERRPPTGVLFTAALALRSDHSAATAAPRCRLDCFNFPHDCGEDAWREEGVFFLFGGAILARRWTSGRGLHPC